MTTEQKFSAAVNVIRSLPKNGAFQPSTDLQLKFYAYFKQATEGPCTKAKPSFWDIPGQAKWKAWRRLGEMSIEEAMNSYIEELKSIVETMSYNANVESFLGSLGSFYDSVPAEHVEMVLGPVLERVRAQVESPSDSSSTQASPKHACNGVSPECSERSSVSSLSQVEIEPSFLEKDDSLSRITKNGSANYCTNSMDESNESSIPKAHVNGDIQEHIPESKLTNKTMSSRRAKRSEWESDDSDEFEDSMTSPMLSNQVNSTEKSVQSSESKKLENTIPTNVTGSEIELFKEIASNLRLQINEINARINSLESAVLILQNRNLMKSKKQWSTLKKWSTTTICSAVLGYFLLAYVGGKWRPSKK